MRTTSLRQCKAAATNIAKMLFDKSFTPDVIEEVIADVAKRHPRIYQAAVDERGRATVHQQMAKSVKKALNASNEERADSSGLAPTKTHRRLTRDTTGEGYPAARVE